MPKRFEYFYWTITFFCAIKKYFIFHIKIKGSQTLLMLTIYSYLQRGWSLSADGYYSFSSQQQRAEEVTIPSTELAQQVIEYARQLEMIV